jgi:hypothetical protein
LRKVADSRLVAELLERIGLQLAGVGVAGIGEHEVVDELDHPPVLARHRTTTGRRGEQRIGAAGQLDVPATGTSTGGSFQRLAGLPSYQLR